MSGPLKSILFLFIVLAVSIHRGAAQDSLAIKDSWQNLKSQLMRRTDVADNLVAVIRKYRSGNRETIEKIKVGTADLRKFIDSFKSIDSLTIQGTNQRNMLLTRALSGALILFMDDPKLKSQQEFMNLQAQLEGSENRIAVARRDFNDICVASGRPDLVFDNTPSKPHRITN